MNKRIAFQGVPGAYSHQAALEYFPNCVDIPCENFEAVLDAVHDGHADFAVLPIENSTYGRVADVHHLLPDAGLHIIGEHYVRVRINWFARPDQDPDQIKLAISHPVLLGQCRKFLRQNQLSWQNWADTASAAKHVAESDEVEISALSSPLAGELYGLKTLAEDVEDQSNNTTRFLILSPHENWVAQGEDVVTSFVFEVRNLPAALYKALGGFATNGVNMTKLESYMVGGRFAATQFYADVQAHPDDVAMKHAFEELGFFTENVKILGVYKGDAIRRAS